MVPGSKPQIKRLIQGMWRLFEPTVHVHEDIKDTGNYLHIVSCMNRSISINTHAHCQFYGSYAHSSKPMVFHENFAN